MTVPYYKKFFAKDDPLNIWNYSTRDNSLRDQDEEEEEKKKKSWVPQLGKYIESLGNLAATIKQQELEEERQKEYALMLNLRSYADQQDALQEENDLLLQQKKQEEELLKQMSVWNRFRKQMEDLSLSVKELDSKETWQRYLDLEALDKTVNNFKKSPEDANGKNEESEDLKSIWSNYKAAYDNLSKLIKAQNAYDRIAGEGDIFNATPEEFKSGLNEEEAKHWNTTELIEDLKDIVYSGLKATNKVNNVEEFNDYWNQMTNEDKMKLAVSYIGANHLDNKALEDFKQDKEHRLEILASYIKSNPFYKTKMDEKKEDSKEKWGFNKWWEKETAAVGNEVEAWGNLIQGKPTLLDIESGGIYRALSNPTTLAFGLAGFAGMKLVELTGGLVENASKFVGNLFSSGESENIDSVINKKAADYINYRSQGLQLTLQQLPEDSKAELLAEFDKLSESIPSYAMEKGTYLTEIQGAGSLADNKLREIARIQTVGELYGAEAALKSLEEFWQNNIAKNQTTMDKLGRTCGGFAANGAAEILSFLGVVLNPVFLATSNPYVLDAENKTNPESNKAGGFTGTLVTNNPILQYASDIQETGSFDPTMLKIYKENNYNATKIYKTVEDENAFMAWDDLYTLALDYGFSALSTLISLGGSKMVSLLAKKYGKEAIKTAERRAAFSERQALKEGLSSATQVAEMTAAKEAIVKRMSDFLYKGNLAVGAMMGTAEGALEAKSTYDTFMEDNTKKIEQMFAEKQKQIDDVSIEALTDFLRSRGELPDTLIKGPDGGSISLYSLAQYDRARKEILLYLEDAKAAAFERLQEDAIDASMANFVSNSFINGALNTFVKESVMSRDLRYASRIKRGSKEKFEDLIDVVKDDAGQWKAVIKNASNSVLKSRWKKFKNAVGKTIKDSSGEFAEEYTQNLSDQTSRAALLHDLNRYLDVVFDPEAREAFQTDWDGMLNAGFETIKTEALSLENIKAGVFGALSSTLGGFSPSGVFLLRGRKENEKGFLGTVKWIGNNLGNLYQGGLKEGYTNYKEDLLIADRLVESTNAWLNSEKHQELMHHLNGALAYKKLLEDAVLTEDGLVAHDSALGIAIENAFMLNKLANTDYGKAMRQQMTDLYGLLSLLETLEEADKLRSEDPEQAEARSMFDSEGNYIGNISLEGGERQPDWVTNVINTYRNRLGDETRNAPMSDKEVVEKVVHNVEKFLEVQKAVANATSRVRLLFAGEDIDPVVHLAFVHALVSLLDTRRRADSLKEKLDTARKDSETPSTLSGLSGDALDFVIRFGSILQAKTKIGQLEEKQAELVEKNKSKDISAEEKALNKAAINRLSRDIKALQFAVNEQFERTLGVTELQKEEGQEVVSVTDSSKQLSFTVKDMLEVMDDNQRAYVLEHKKSYSKETQKVIDDFLTVVRQQLSNRDSDLKLTNDEVENDFKDLNDLQDRSDAYDKYLNDYINNPLFLTTLAAQHRQNARISTLKYLYKDDLLTKEGETPLQVQQRIDNKIEELKKQGKYEDAEILRRLKNENPTIKKIQKNLLELLKIYAVYASMSEENRKESQTDEFQLMFITLLTLISNGAISAKEILEYLNSPEVLQGDFSKAVNLLMMGGSLRKNLLKENLDPIIDESTTDVEDVADALSEVFDTMKTFLDTYFKFEERSKKSVLEDSNNDEDINEDNEDIDTEDEDINDADDSAGDEGNGNIPDEDKAVVNIDGEPTQIKLLTLGHLDPDSTQDSWRLLAQYLERNGADKNIILAEPGKMIRFIVVPNLNKEGNPWIIAVQPASKDALMFEYEGEAYMVIGAIDPLSSPNLSMKAKSALVDMEEGLRIAMLEMQPGIPIQASASMSEPLPVGEDNIEDAKPLRERYKGEELDNYVRETTANGQRVNIKNAQGTTVSSRFEDANGYVIEFNDTGKASNLVDFPVESPFEENKTITLKLLAEEVQNKLLGLSEKERQDLAKKVIASLKKNPYFEAWFDVWADPESLLYNGDNRSKVLYQRLIGDFVFMGWPNEAEPTKNSQIQVEILPDSNLLTISNKSTSNKSTIRIPLPTNTSEDKREVAGLTAIFNIVASASGFLYCNLQMGSKEVTGYARPEHKNKSISEKRKEGERKRLKGLILAGLVNGYKPRTMRREIRINNPFNPKGTPTRASGTKIPTGPNISNPDNLGSDPPKKGPKQRQLAIADSANAPSIAEIVLNKMREMFEGRATLPDKNDSHYTLIDEQGAPKGKAARVTGVKHAFRVWGKDYTSEPSEVPDNTATQIANALGDLNDAVRREVIELLNNEYETYHIKGRDKKQVDDIVNKIFDKVQKLAPNYQKSQLKSIIRETALIYEYLKNLGYKFYPKGINVILNAPVQMLVVEGGKYRVQEGILPVSGTLDLMVINGKGQIEVIDFKTYHATASGDELALRLEAWSVQTSTYREGLIQMAREAIIQLKGEGQFSDITVELLLDLIFSTKTFIWPTKLEYSNDVDSAGIEIETETIGDTKVSKVYTKGAISGRREFSPNGVLNPHLKGETLSTFDKVGTPFMNNNFFEEYDALSLHYYNYDSLSPEDLALVIPVGANGPTLDPHLDVLDNNNPGEDSNIKVPKPEEFEASGAPVISSDDVANWERDNNPRLNDDDDDSIISIDMLSSRTAREARYTEFVNSRLRPVEKIKVSITRKLKGLVLALLVKNGKQRVLKKELANIFFNGDVTKLELVLKGQDITLNNLPNIITTLLKYYNNYVLKKELYKKNITRRYYTASIVLDYLKNNITEAKMLELLEQLGVNPAQIPELTEYIYSENPAQTALKIIQRIEDSKTADRKNVQEEVDNLALTIDAMQAKLDLLNSRNAVSLITERVNSVYDALIENRYEQVIASSNETISDILNKREGSYGATKLLQGIVVRSKNTHFKKLARELLKKIREKKMSIQITVEDGGLGFIEGSTNGKFITILKTSLDSYEHFERVLLHEMIHAVVSLSPEMKDSLLQVLDKAILSLQEATGKTIKELKEEYYGFTNINEFISEFFTNYAFLETLKSLDHDKPNNIFDRFVRSIKELFTGDRTIYNQTSKLMENILNTTNIESAHKKKDAKESTEAKEKFSSLPIEMQLNILAKGFTAKQFENLSTIERLHVKMCCK